MQNTRQKGRRLVKWLIAYFKQFDPTAYEVVGSGSGSAKGDMQVPRANLVIEAKNQQTMPSRQDVLQAKRQAFTTQEFALIFRHPDSSEANPECYVTIHLDYFLKLLSKGTQTLVEGGNSQEARYTVQRAITSLKAVLKLYNQ